MFATMPAHKPHSWEEASYPPPAFLDLDSNLPLANPTSVSPFTTDCHASLDMWGEVLMNMNQSDLGVDSDAIDLNGLALDTSNINWETDGFEASPDTSDPASFDNLQVDNLPSAFDPASPAQADYWPVDNGSQRSFKPDGGSRRLKTTLVDLMSSKTEQSSTPDSSTSPPSPFAAHTRPEQPARRRNRRRNTAESSATTGSTESQVRNRERFLERNRVAAAKCRQRKKEWTSNLENRARELAKHNNLLQRIVDSQRGEIMTLKRAVLEHAQCGSLDLERYFRYDQGIGHGNGTQTALGGQQEQQQQHGIQQGQAIIKMEDEIDAAGKETSSAESSVT